MEIVPTGGILGTEIVSDDTEAEPRRLRRVQVMASRDDAAIVQ